MASRTFKNGISRLSGNYMTRRQREGIIINRNMFVVDNTFSTNNKSESPDTVERKKIHTMIIELVEEGKNKSEIVSSLINEFPESSLREFFDSYAQHHLDKKVEMKVDKYE